MNKNNAKALSTLRQKIRKYNRDYENEIASYKEVRFSTNKIAVFLLGITINRNLTLMRIFCS